MESSKNATEAKTDSDESKKKISFKDTKKLFIKKLIKSFLTYIWDKKTKKFCGRDSYDWGLLGTMYFLFYIGIGCFGWAMLAIFMQINTSTHGNVPKYYGSESPLGYSTPVTPGMGVRPHYGKDLSQIEFSVGSVSKYTDFLNRFLQEYQDNLSYGNICSDTNKKEPCKFNIFEYLDQLNCSKDSNYGYSSGAPCVLIKLNNVIEWTPDSVKIPDSSWYTSAQNCTNFAASSNTQKLIYVACTGQSASDTSNINSITFSSPLGVNSCLGGVPFYYYPYQNGPKYMQPLVVVKLELKRETNVALKCSAWANNIQINEKSGAGHVKFSMKISS